MSGPPPARVIRTAAVLTIAAVLLATTVREAAQSPTTPPQASTAPAAAVAPPSGYVIGPDDVLSVTFWREKDMSADVVVRPDGKITLPLLNEIHAAGLTPAQLREKVLSEATRYVEDPAPTVVVKAINSRKVFITGQVEKPGTYPLGEQMTVIQLIALAGGLKEFADKGGILVMRTEPFPVPPGTRPVAYKFDYSAVLKRRNLRQNIELKPGDTVVVP